MKSSSGVTAVAVTMLLCSASAAQAQEKPETDYPGSAWNATGILSPAEGGNLVSQSYAEQGVRLHLDEETSIIPFVAFGATFDSEGLDWNNKVNASVGVKLEHTFNNGVVALRGGYALEHRTKTDVSRSEPFVQAEYWVGWGSGKNDLFPGNSWGALSYNLPSEPKNVQGVVYAQQGYRAYQDKDVSIIPIVEFGASKDSIGRDWNNYIRGAIGVKAAVNGCHCDFKVAYAHEYRFESKRSSDGIIASVNFWFGWNLKK